MKLLAELADIAALFHGWNETERKYLADELAELEKRINTMPTIDQSALDKLAADVAANTQAIADAATRAGTLQTTLGTVQQEVDTLKQQLADAGTPADTSALDAAIQAATSQAQGIAQSAASTPAPVVPVTDPANPTGPVVAPPDTTSTSPDTGTDPAAAGSGV